MAAKNRSGRNRTESRNVVAEARRGPARRPISWPAVWENARSLLVAVAIFLVIRAFLIEAYRIPSPSMVPTLLVSDWLFVNKLRYGPHVPFTGINLPGYAEPARGDVVVFKSPPQRYIPGSPDIRIGPDVITPTLVKRLVGMPGDTLYMRNDTLHANGVPQTLPFETRAGRPEEIAYHHPLFDWQRPYQLARSRFPAPPERPTLGNWGPIVIPPRHYFMLGDNRHESVDSRYYGLVPRENIRGRPLFVYYSFSPSSESGRVFPAITAIRWGRIGDVIR